MVIGKKNDDCSSFTPQMPLKIRENERYMNDAVCSVLGKYTRATKHQKNGKYYGGIWDCDTVVVTQPSESFSSVAPGSFINSICSPVAISSIRDQHVQGIDEDSDLFASDDLFIPTSQIRNEAISTEDFDRKAKRWRYEDLNKKSRFSDTETELEESRKRTKKTVLFSDSMIHETRVLEQTNLDADFKMDVTEVSKNPTKLNFENKQIENWMKEEDEINPLSDALHQHSPQPSKMISNSLKRNQPSSKEDASNQNKHHDITKSSDEKAPLTMLAKNCDEVENPLSVELKQQSSQPIKMNSNLKKTRSSSKEKFTSNKKKIHNITKPIDEKSSLKLLVKNSEEMEKEMSNRIHLKSLIPELFEIGEPKPVKRSNATVKSSNQKKVMDQKTVKIEVTDMKEISRSVKKTQLSPEDDIGCSVAITLSENESQSKMKSVEKDMHAASSGSTKTKLHVTKPEVNEVSEQKIDELPNCLPVKKLLQQISASKEESCLVVNNLKDDYNHITVEGMILSSKHLVLEPQKKSESSEISVKLINAKREMENCESIRDMSSSTSYLNGDRSVNTSFGSKSNSTHFNWRDSCVDRQPMFEDKRKSPNARCSASKNWREDCVNFQKLSPEYKENSSAVENFSKKDIKYSVEDSMDTSMDITLETPFHKKKDDSRKENVSEVYPVTELPANRFRTKVIPDPESIWGSPLEKTAFANSRQAFQQNHHKIYTKSKEINDQSPSNVGRFIVPIFYGSPEKRFQVLKNKAKEENSTQHNGLRIGSESETRDYNSRSRTASRGDRFAYSKSYEYHRSKSLNWRNRASYAVSDPDVLIVLKVIDEHGVEIEELKVLKEKLLDLKKEVRNLSHIIPDPHYKNKKVAYSASAVKVLLRCILSQSYILPNWKTVLETYAIAKRFHIEDLMKNCEGYFIKYPREIPSDQINAIADLAKHLQVIEALKSSKIYKQVQNYAEISSGISYPVQICSVSCSIYVEPTEFVIPLIFEETQDLLGTNTSDLQNRIIFKSFSGTVYITSVQLKLQMEGGRLGNELHIFCEVFKGKSKLFYEEVKERAKRSLKITFGDGLLVKENESIEISILIEDICLRMCSQLHDEKYVRPGKFYASFESDKRSESKKLFFFIEKLFFKLL